MSFIVHVEAPCPSINLQHDISNIATIRAGEVSNKVYLESQALVRSSMTVSHSQAVCDLRPDNSLFQRLHHIGNQIHAVFDPA